MVSDGILPLVVDLRINCQCRAGLGMTCFGGYCGNADVRVGEQDTDKGVAKHMRVDFADARFLSHAVNNFAIVVGADGPAEIIDNDSCSAAGKEQSLVVVQQMSCANRVESALLCSRLLLCMRILLFYKWFVLLYHFAV